MTVKDILTRDQRRREAEEEDDHGASEGQYEDPNLLRPEPGRYLGDTGTNGTGSRSKSSLTVGKRSKVEQELHKHEEASHAPSKWLTVSKWIVGILLSVSFTFCLIFSKVGIIYLGHDLYINLSAPVVPTPTPAPPPPGGDDDRPVFDTNKPPEATLAMLILILLVPNVTTFLRALWCGGFSADRPWPNIKAFFAGVFTSVLESMGLALFVLGVMATTEPSVGVLLLNGVFLAHAACMLFQTLFRSGGNRNYCLAFTLLLAVVLSLVGIVLTVFCYSCPNMLRRGVAVWTIPTSLIALSIAWCNPLQRLQIMPRMTRHLQRQIDQVTHRKLQDSYIESTQGPPKTAMELDMLVTAYPTLSARWKNTIITSILKMILIPCFLLLFCCQFHKNIDLHKLSYGFHYITPLNPLFPFFLLNVICSWAGYLLGWLACTMSMQRLAFALPLTIATPIAFVLVLYIEACQINIFTGASSTAKCDVEFRNLAFVVPSVVCLYVAQILSTGYYVFQGQSMIMEKESQMFWLPGYVGAFLEQHLLLSRKTLQTDSTQKDRLKKAQSSRVFICTTMYREAAHEMKQLLRSLGRINRAKQQSDRHFQAHIFFDNGVRHKRLTPFALQLVVVAGKALGLRLKECQKIQTPYGLQLRWVLPTVIQGKRGMDFVIHLKDNLMVKNKKRWSQVMYMSYVLDYFVKTDPGATDNNTLILTTDADVDFTPSSVEALLDLMTRDDKVGAVCARTYPMGSGPVVWYQTFDYAIGHWFQKAANHVLGTVLCCPGCFSVYRAEALRHVLPTYATSVTRASEFLTKDMGEDRWLCTLLVQCGWRLEYSAAADNHTYCPEEFDEFFKQRRRWVPSTLANLALLLQEWKTVYYFNNKISLLFLLYQAALLFSTLVSPAVCMLVVTGGVYYAWGVSQYVSMTLMYLATVAYIIICLFGSADLQLKAAKVLTVLGAFVMAAVTVGTAVQIVQESQPAEILNETLTTPTTHTHTITEVALPISITSLYLAGIVSMFVIAALLHLPEAYCLLHGIWYLWCLPAGFIILLTYSIVNLTDRSWGTREEKKEVIPSGIGGAKGIILKIKNFFSSSDDDHKDKSAAQAAGDEGSDDDDEGATDDDQVDGAAAPAPRQYQQAGKSRPPKKSMKYDRYSSFRFHYKETGHEPSKVSQWLPGTLRDQYATVLEDAGYDDTSFLVGMTDDELLQLGVKVKAHRQALLTEIRTLGDPEIEPFVPETIEDWLKVINLSMYYNNFRKMHIVSGKQMEILKSMSREDIKEDLGITKPGHLRRLLLAIKKLRYPTESEMIQGQVKAKLELLPTKGLTDSEHAFWDELRHEKLLPTSTAFSDDFELKEKLTELRNSAIVVFGVANTIWIILILTLVPKSQLNVLGTNALGLSFLVIFGLVMFVQFCCMVIHRLSTFVHLIARAPPKCGDPYHINWSFTDSNFRPPASVRRRTNIFEESLDVELAAASSQIQRHSTIDEDNEHAA